MGVSNSTRVTGAIPARRPMGLRVLAVVIVLLLVLAALTLAIAPTASAAETFPRTAVTSPFDSFTADGGVGIADIPEYFVSPLTGVSYRIFKDAERGTYRYCIQGGGCFATPLDVMTEEAKSLPAWALAVAPALRDRIAVAGLGSNEVARVIIELRDGTFSHVATAAWASIEPQSRALEARASAFAALGVSDKATMDRIDALNDATRSR
ncbi:MAG TPA: hypothetical protein VK723_04360, partial [Thermoplasmata archaeon]|nr:hypothetical protein [Thermoplasmata archaeon]